MREKSFKIFNSNNGALSLLKMRATCVLPTFPAWILPEFKRLTSFPIGIYYVCKRRGHKSAEMRRNSSSHNKLYNPEPKSLQRVPKHSRITHKVLLAREGFGRVPWSGGRSVVPEPNRSLSRISFVSPASLAVKSPFFPVFERSEGIFF